MRELGADEVMRAVTAQAVAFSLRDAVATIDSMLAMERAPAQAV